MVPRADAPETPTPLWRGVTLARGYSLEDAPNLNDWVAVEAFTEARLHVESHDPDCVTFEASKSPTIEVELVESARVAAARVGGEIKELGRR